jgi:hypothetical protein
VIRDHLEPDGGADSKRLALAGGLDHQVVPYVEYDPQADRGTQPNFEGSAAAARAAAKLLGGRMQNRLPRGAARARRS